MSGLLPLPWRDRPTIMLLALQKYNFFQCKQEKNWVATLQANFYGNRLQRKCMGLHHP